MDEPLASCMIVHFSAHISKWELVCKFGVIFHIFIISCLCSRFHVRNQWFFLLCNNLFIYQVLCTLIYRRRSLYSFLIQKLSKEHDFELLRHWDNAGRWNPSSWETAAAFVLAAKDASSPLLQVIVADKIEKNISYFRFDDDKNIMQMMDRILSSIMFKNLDQLFLTGIRKDSDLGHYSVITFIRNNTV